MPQIGFQILFSTIAQQIFALSGSSMAQHSKVISITTFFVSLGPSITKKEKRKMEKKNEESKIKLN